MDYIRFPLMIGLAAVAYALLLAWQEDFSGPDALLTPAPALSASVAPISSDTPVPQSPLESRTQDLGDLPAATIEPAAAVVTTAVEKASLNQRIQVQTDLLDVEIDLYGGDIVHLGLREYPQQHGGAADFELLSQNLKRTYVAQSGMIGTSGKDLDSISRPLYQARSERYEMRGDVLEVPLTHRLDSGVVVHKVYRFKVQEYAIDLSFEVENPTDTPWQGRLFTQLKRDGSEDPESEFKSGAPLPTYLGMAYWRPDEPYNKLKFKEIASAANKNTLAFNEQIAGGWVALIQHYFVSAWAMNPDQLHHYSARRNSEGHYLIGAVAPTLVVNPGQQGTASAVLYAGPKIQKDLKAVAPGLDLAIDYGFLFFISNGLFQVLQMLYGVMGNWGWAIVGLTCLIKLLFYYPSAVSYRSMAKMRKVQPELLALRDRYKDDRQQLSAEMMKLYKDKKINPLGGCLPVLLQMPVFLALYWALLESVELRHAGFMLWIQDLSVMDPYFVLPLLMGASMYVQTSLNPAPPDPMQAKLMKMMPVIFTVFFLFFPAGLVLYWLTNNLLSIAQQWYITRQVEAQD